MQGLIKFLLSIVLLKLNTARITLKYNLIGKIYKTVELDD